MRIGVIAVVLVLSVPNLAQDDRQYWATSEGLMGEYSKSSDKTWVNTMIFTATGSEWEMSGAAAQDISVSFDYECPGKTVRCRPREVEFEIYLTFAETPEKFKDGNLKPLEFVADSRPSVQIGQPLEWSYSKCWLEGQRTRCGTGAMTTSLTRAEFLQVAGSRTRLKAVVSGVGSVIMKGEVLEHIRAAADMIK